MVIKLVLIAMTFLFAPLTFGGDAKIGTPASRPAGEKGNKKLMAELREAVEKFRDLNEQIEVSSARKAELEKQLEVTKKRRNPRFFRGNDLQTQQAELHRLTKEREELIRQRRDLAMEIMERSPAWRQSLSHQVENSQEDPEAVARRIKALETLTRECHRLFGPGMGPFAGGHGGGAGPMRMFMDFRDRRQPDSSIENQVLRLERQQEVLRSIMKENEELLADLRKEKKAMESKAESPSSKPVEAVAPKTSP